MCRYGLVQSAIGMVGCLMCAYWLIANADAEAGLGCTNYKLNPVVTHSLKAPGFNC